MMQALGPAGADSPPKRMAFQSQSLSDKHHNKFRNDKLSDHLFQSVYKGMDELSSLEIVRFAINEYQSPCAPIEKGELFDLEKKIFQLALPLLQKATSADKAIAENLGIQNNVVMIDFFVTIPVEKTDKIQIKKAKTGDSAETHTICMWKRTNTHFYIIDPSLSSFSERLQGSVQKLLQEAYQNRDVKCTSLNYPDQKFYVLPQNQIFVQHSESDFKARDCVDVALKIAIVLNENVRFNKNSFEILHSISLLSNQSSVNQTLGDKNNDGILIKWLQSTKRQKRLHAISRLSSVPFVFKQHLNFNAWIRFTQLDSEKQEVILNTLMLFNKEITLSKFLEQKREPDIQFDRLIKLSKYCESFLEMQRRIGADGDVKLGIKRDSFI